MADKFFEKRILELNSQPVDPSGECVIYWMQRSQRARANLALKFAADLANELGKPLLVYFGLFDGYPMASARAFKFMLEGLREIGPTLSEDGIGFALQREHPAQGIVRASREFRACAVIVDEDYLNIGRQWRSEAAASLALQLVQVDAETVVPARITEKEEWGAYTLRPKILKVLSEHLTMIPESRIEHKWQREVSESVDLSAIDPGQLAVSLQVDQQVEPSPHFTGGLTQAEAKLHEFIENRLSRYASERNEIGVEVTSELSPYLHFGQVSALRVALEVGASDAPDECVDAFLEQLIVRRELAINFCLHNPHYSTLDSATDWARRTLSEHRHDPRQEIYTVEELESAQTHDELWNAAQTELVRLGKIHGYMRMVWAKSLLQWLPTPEEALACAIYLNDKYALDGRDPNGYANIAWCIHGKHDRPFATRPVFGNIRFMSTAATKRKTRWREYVARVG